MRRWSPLASMALLGCARLNPAFAEEAEGTGGGSSASEAVGSTTAHEGTTSSASGSGATTSGDPGGTSEVTGASAPGTTLQPLDMGALDTSADTTTSTTSAGEDAVLLVWAPDEALSIPQPPTMYCQASAEGLGIECASEPTPLATLSEDDTLQALVMQLEADYPGAEVHGVEGDGTQPIATTPADLLVELLIPLSMASVRLSDNHVFWTGVGGITCDGWTLVDGLSGTVGSQDMTSGWYDNGTSPCELERYMLCVCASMSTIFD